MCLLCKRRKNRYSLAERMRAVDWAIQRIGAQQSRLKLMRYRGEIPEHPPFHWVKSGNGEGVFSYFTPGLKGEPLSHQHLTPEQMAYCLLHLEELEGWARELEELEARERELGKLRRDQVELASEERKRAERAEYEQKVLRHFQQEEVTDLDDPGRL